MPFIATQLAVQKLLFWFDFTYFSSDNTPQKTFRTKTIKTTVAQGKESILESFLFVIFALAIPHVFFSKEFYQVLIRPKPCPPIESSFLTRKNLTKNLLLVKLFCKLRSHGVLSHLQKFRIHWLIFPHTL